MDRTKLIKGLNLNVSDKKQIVEMEKVFDSFITTLQKIHKKSEADAEMIYEREAMYFKKAIADNAKLQNCTTISLYSAFLEIAITGLSIQGGSKSEAYLESRGAKQPDGSYINAAYLRVTAYGELNMRIMSGQIVRMNNPQVIYDGDVFQPKTNEKGDLIVDYRPQIPRMVGAKIVGCYVCVVLPNDGRDFKWLLLEDIERLRKYSERGMGGKANALYNNDNGQIDVGFLEAKTIKHAMRAYTKLRVSDSISFDEDENQNSEQTFQPDNAPAQTQPESVTFNSPNDGDDIF